MTLTGSLRFARYQLALWRRTWYGSAFSIFVAPLLYLSAIGLGIGAIVEGGGTSAALGGVSYAAFAGTGLLAAAAMQTAAGDQSWPVLGALTYTGTWEASTSTPLLPGDLVGGKSLLLVVRLTLSSAVFAAALVLFDLVEPGRALAAIAPAVLAGMAWGPPMFAFAAWAADGVYISYVFRFVIVPAFILSGTFFPASELPAVVQPVVAVSPLWHGLELVRSVSLGQPTTLHPLVHVGVQVLAGGLGAHLAVRSLTRRLQP